MDANLLEGAVVRLKSSWSEPKPHEYGVVLEVVQFEHRKVCDVLHVGGGRAFVSVSGLEACPLEKRPEVVSAVLTEFEARAQESHKLLKRLRTLLNAEDPT